MVHACPSLVRACGTAGTHTVRLGGWLWLVCESPAHQLNHGQVDKQVLVLRLHHGRTLLTHLLNNAVHTEVLGNGLGQRLEVRSQSVFWQHLVTNQLLIDWVDGLPQERIMRLYAPVCHQVYMYMYCYRCTEGKGLHHYMYITW